MVVDLADGIDLDLAFFHRVARAHPDVRVHPDTHAASDVAAPDRIAQGLDEDHNQSLSRTLRKRAANADEKTVAVCHVHTRCSHPRSAQRGFVLIATSIAITLLLGLAGLAIDVGRMYVIRAELQSFTDAAALTVASEWDGSTAGQDRAKAGAKNLTEGPHAMRWDMGTRAITDMTVSFPAAPDGSHTVRVMASEPAPVIFLRVFQSRESTTVAAASVAMKDGTKARLTQ